MSEAKKIKDKFSTKESSPTRLSYEMVFANRLLKNEEYDPDEKILHSDLKKALDDQEDKFDVQLSFEKIKTHEESFIRGMQEGEKLAIEKLQEGLSPLFTALEEVEEHVESMLGELKPYMAKMVFDLAEKVIDHPIESELLRTQVQKEVTAVLSDLETNVKVKIIVSNQDFKGIQKLLTKRIDSDRLELSSNEELKPGEYKIETGSEVVVKQFKEILKDFKTKVSLLPKEGGEVC